MSKRNYNDLITKLLKRLPHKSQVSFALACAKDVLEYVRSEDKAIIDNAIRVTELWLIDKVTPEECHAAYAAAYYAASNAASCAAYYAASYAAYAAYVASSAANAVSNAASAAAYTASYAANDASKETKLKEYYYKLVKSIKEMPELDRIIYDIDLNIIDIEEGMYESHR